VARKHEETVEELKSLGEQVTEMPAVQEFLKQGAKGRVGVEVKAIISALTTALRRVRPVRSSFRIVSRAFRALPIVRCACATC
jgi:hypothetical protein